MIRNLPIRSKLVAVLVLPIVALLALASLRVAGDVSASLQARRVSQVTSFAGKLAGLVHELQKERDLAAGYIGSGRKRGYGAMIAQRVWVNQASMAFQAELAKVDLGRPGSNLAKRVTHASEELGGLQRERRLVAGDAPVQVDPTLAGYNEIIVDLLEGISAIAGESDDSALVSQIQGFAALSRAKESTALARSLVYAVLIAGSFGPGQYQRFVSAIGARETWLAEFEAFATDGQRSFLSATVSGRDVQRASNLTEQVLAEDRRGRLGLDPREWLTVATAQVDLMRVVEQRLVTNLVAAAKDVKKRAERQAVVGVLLVLLVLAVSVGLSVVMARSMVRSLRVLRRTAHDVAERRLPDAVERLQRLRRREEMIAEKPGTPLAIGSRDEIGKVAEAFNSVHDVAIEVSMQQAGLRRSVGDMFLNLAQRNQTLIDRQLELIDELEHHELDPRKLEELFRLDHLATRMRRNAENLIVLSGAQPARRWSQPVVLVDAIRAAISEVEDYTRVDVLPVDEVGVAGDAVGDVVHLLAELIENATGFSPPGTPVHVGGQQAQDGYVVEIEDRGIGMTEAELAEANSKLAVPPDIDLTLSERLGLYVVGRLARRHDIRVHLRQSFSDGVAALVLLPSALLVRAQPRGEPESRRMLAPPAHNGAPPDPPSLAAGAATSPEALPIFEATRSQFLEPTGEPPTVPSMDRPPDHIVTSPGPLFGMPSDVPTAPGVGSGLFEDSRAIEDEPPHPSITQVGLPRRVPRANLAPGIAADQSDPWSVKPFVDDRSPEEIRSRLTDLRAGAERGRRAASAWDGDALIGTDHLWSRSDNDATE